MRFFIVNVCNTVNRFFFDANPEQSVFRGLIPQKEGDRSDITEENQTDKSGCRASSTQRTQRIFLRIFIE